MLHTWNVLDISTAPIDGAADYLEGAIKAPSNYKDPAKIAEYVAEKWAERLAMAATDVDLARITGVAYDADEQDGPKVTLLRTEDEEAHYLAHLADHWHSNYPGVPAIVTFGGRRFDLPMLMRRARYLGIDFPTINLDRFKSPHVDLCDVLSDREPSRMRPLTFYVRRLSWGLVKPLSGEEESQVPVTGRWDELSASLLHDVTAVRRLAQWAEIIP